MTTLGDIAASLEVSTSLVSKVLNGKMGTAGCGAANTVTVDSTISTRADANVTDC